MMLTGRMHADKVRQHTNGTTRHAQGAAQDVMDEYKLQPGLGADSWCADCYTLCLHPAWWQVPRLQW
jgi:hypothetical protein